MVSDPWDLPPVSKAAERFSFPTLTNSIRFGNTRNPFYREGLIFSHTLGLYVPSVEREIVIGKLIPIGDMPPIFSHIFL